MWASVWRYQWVIWPSKPFAQSHFYINAGLAIDFTELLESLRLRTMANDANGNMIIPPSELSLPGGD